MDRPAKIVIWDNIGNTVLGLRPWTDWDLATQQRFLAEHEDAEDRIVTIEQLFAPGEIELSWIYDPVKSRRGFAAFIDEHQDILIDSNDRAAVAQAIVEADVVISHKETVPAELVERADRLRLIQHLGKDARGLPLDVIQARNLLATATPLVNYTTVAEQAWATILSLQKRLSEQRAVMEQTEPPIQWGPNFPRIRPLSDLTIGFVGFGEIARPMARVAAAFNMRIQYWDVQPFPDLEAEYGVQWADWDDLWVTSDIVSLQLALNEKTQGLVGEWEFEHMKPDAIFQNSARGKLVNEGDLIAILQAGLIGGAALDVYYDEPLSLDSPLRELQRTHPERVMLTPHSGSAGPWTWVRDSQELWFNVRRLLNGEPVHHVIGA